MKLKARDCPLKIEYRPRGAGWTRIVICVGDKEHYISSSGYTGDQFGDLVNMLFCFNSSGKFGGFSQEGYRDKKHIESVYDQVIGGKKWDAIPIRGEIEFDGEQQGYTLIFEREPTLHADFDVKMTVIMDEYTSNKAEYHYTFRYKDICYAVAKAYTDAIKRFGLTGLFVSNGWLPPVDINQMLYLKAFALKCVGKLRLRDYDWLWSRTDAENEAVRKARLADSNSPSYAGCSNLNKEMEILLFNM